MKRNAVFPERIAHQEDRDQGAAYFAVLVAISLIVFVTTFPSLWHIEASDTRNVETCKILIATKTVSIDIFEQESDVRGLLLSRDASFLGRAHAWNADIRSRSTP